MLLLCVRVCCCCVRVCVVAVVVAVRYDSGRRALRRCAARLDTPLHDRAHRGSRAVCRVQALVVLAAAVAQLRGVSVDTAGEVVAARRDGRRVAGTQFESYLRLGRQVFEEGRRGTLCGGTTGFHALLNNLLDGRSRAAGGG